MKFLTLCCGVCGAAAVAGGAEFFVAPNGSDTNSGTRAKPFASFQQAQLAVRGERAAHPKEEITVTFRPGRYTLDRPVEFGPEDSGASAALPVRYQAEPGRTVIFSGGRAIQGW